MCVVTICTVITLSAIVTATVKIYENQIWNNMIYSGRYIEIEHSQETHLYLAHDHPVHNTKPQKGFL